VILLSAVNNLCCPYCGGDLEEHYGRVECEHIPTAKPSTIKDTNKLKRYWTCKKCKQDYAYVMKIAPVKVIERKW